MFSDDRYNDYLILKSKIINNQAQYSIAPIYGRSSSTDSWLKCLRSHSSNSLSF